MRYEGTEGFCSEEHEPSRAARSLRRTASGSSRSCSEVAQTESEERDSGGSPCILRRESKAHGRFNTFKVPGSQAHQKSPAASSGTAGARARCQLPDEEPGDSSGSGACSDVTSAVLVLVLLLVQYCATGTGPVVPALESTHT